MWDSEKVPHPVALPVRASPPTRHIGTLFFTRDKHAWRSTNPSTIRSGLFFSPRRIPSGTSPELAALLQGLLRRSAKDRMEFDGSFLCCWCHLSSVCRNLRAFGWFPFFGAQISSITNSSVKTSSSSRRRLLLRLSPFPARPSGSPHPPRRPLSSSRQPRPQPGPRVTTTTTTRGIVRARRKRTISCSSPARTS